MKKVSLAIMLLVMVGCSSEIERDVEIRTNIMQCLYNCHSITDNLEQCKDYCFPYRKENK